MARAIPREGEERAATNVANPSGKLWIPTAKPEQGGKDNQWLALLLPRCFQQYMYNVHVVYIHAMQVHAC